MISSPALRPAAALLAVSLFLAPVGAQAQEIGPALTVQHRDGKDVLTNGGFTFREAQGSVLDFRVLSLEGSATRVATWRESGDPVNVSWFAVAPRGLGWYEPTQSSFDLLLRYAQFDPITNGEPQLLDGLSARPTSRLWLVQFHTQGLPEYRTQIEALGGEVFQYVPNHAHVVRMDASVADAVRALPYVRWVGHYHPAYRLEEFLLDEVVAGGSDTMARRYMYMVTSKAEKDAIRAQVRELGGTIPMDHGDSIVDQAKFTWAQLLEFVHDDRVIFVDRYTEPEEDINNGRIQGNADYVEGLAGYTGIGVRGHVMEGIDPTHPDFAATAHRSTPIVHLASGAQDHGHCTYGIVYGSGAGNAQARGLAPDAQGVYTNYLSVSIYQTFTTAVTQQQTMSTTKSWGGSRTTIYNNTSAEADDAVYDSDMTATQSQSNAGTTASRPEAWGKNIISVGAMQHYDNSNPADDSWSGGNASIGPAADGRIKPDVCAYYDAILTTDRPGSAGYTSNNYYSSFGGTSGATPMVQGFTLLLHQMWTDGIFGNILPNPTGTRFQNRAHFGTIKALLIASAKQYDFSGLAHDKTRVHQGWGFPDVGKAYDTRMKALVVDEQDVLQVLQSSVYSVSVPQGEPELKIALTWREPGGTTSATQHRINDLDLKVTSPTGQEYWGNYNMKSSPWSSPTTSSNRDRIDTVECVFVQNPVAGAWTIEVIAREINQDNHAETPGLDVDYSLVALGGFAQPPCTGTAVASGQGCRDLANIFGVDLEMRWSGEFCPNKTVTIGTKTNYFVVSPQVLVMGTNTTNWNGLALPFDMTGIGAPNCSIYTDHAVVFPVTPAPGGADLTLPIPNDPATTGLTLHWQGYIISTQANALGLASSDVLTTTIGM
ncbi:MAG: S8 family serine peptidase [Planctomycetes bacterium]|nr:S8 family serine peptidase [Planctomycetota bacterium]